MRQFIRLSPEAQAVAADMHRRGKTVNVGDPLPENLPRALAEEIQANLGWFRLAWYLAPAAGKE
jgi:hypothetical protein